MVISEEQQYTSDNSQQKHYLYVIIGQHETVRLNVDNKDVILNADGILDCPFDTVLRKNQYTFEDLNTFLAREIQFIEVAGDKEEILQSISLDMNL